MLKNILVPLDGSDLAEGALACAEVLARRCGAALTLVRATQVGHTLGALGTAQMRAMDEAEAYLSGLAETLADRGIQVATGVPYGSAAGWITEEAEFRKADLIVMATHARTGPDRWLRGSVAEAVVSHATVPVLMLRSGVDLRSAERLEQPTPTLVVPLDGSPFAEAALPVAGELATLLEAQLVLVSVLPAPGQPVAGEGAIVTYVGETFERLQTEAHSYLATTASRLGPAVATEAVVRLGEPAEQIALEAEQRSAAAVIMATHGRAGAVRSLLGSVAGGVLHRVMTPVVVVRPSAAHPAETPAAGETTPVARSGG
jgi:nucleotide-binding universal stress UspA family protein